ncbi:hypothetical protein [Candidatus Xianfuyuplasma coldseepsis]|uniref:Lipoprotein n=1 Tax=Candidatus Xianfuyuplasma coldseepsis TaxID=2782163 RepID=A0A7L7KSX1_9MOLU|nr:hypothetical protein [Xianfuyuplasma coldseepsis]QMS85372.1 hypothetical protein G4Z02_06270 [Xianfuyuplasma coldseepsis]
MRTITFILILILTTLLTACIEKERAYLDCLQSGYSGTNECSLQQGYDAVKKHFETKVSDMEWDDISAVTGYYYIINNRLELNITLDTSQTPLNIEFAEQAVSLYTEMYNEMEMVGFEHKVAYLRIDGYEFDGLYMYPGTEGPSFQATINVEDEFYNLVENNENYMKYLLDIESFVEKRISFISPTIDGGISPDYTQKSILLTSTTANEISSIYFDPIFSETEESNIRVLLRELFSEFTIVE